MLLERPVVQERDVDQGFEKLIRETPLSTEYQYNASVKSGGENPYEYWVIHMGSHPAANTIHRFGELIFVHIPPCASLHLFGDPGHTTLAFFTPDVAKLDDCSHFIALLEFIDIDSLLGAILTVLASTLNLNLSS